MLFRPSLVDSGERGAPRVGNVNLPDGRVALFETVQQLSRASRATASESSEKQCQRESSHQEHCFSEDSEAVARRYEFNASSRATPPTMDHWIWQRLWHWCCRRHPKKNGHWIADRYFVREGTRGWVFQASRRVVKGKIVKRPWDKDRPYPTLRLMSDTKIKRHTKIKQNANP